MPKDPDEKNFNAPLRLLRRHLGCSQLDLAAWCDIPIDTVRDHENGRVRSMTPELLRKIGVTIGAAWDHVHERWVIGNHSVKSTKPISREYCQKYREMLSDKQAAKQLKELHGLSIKQRVDAFLDNIPEELMTALALDFNDVFEQMRVKWLPENRATRGVFGKTQLRLAAEIDKKTNLPLRVNLLYPPQLDHKPDPHPLLNFSPIQGALK